MAIQVNIPTKAAMTALSISPALIDSLEAETGLKIQAMPSCLKAAVDGEVVATLPIKVTILQKAIATPDELTPMEKAALKTAGMNFMQAISQNAQKAPVAKTGAMPLLKPGVSEAPQAGSTATEAQHGTVDDKLVHPLATIETAPRSKLAAATRLYEPVYATSDNSRYFVVAAGQFLNVAARFKHHRLSVRVEGKAFANYTGALTEFGFSNAGDGSYASMHFDDLTPEQAQKALGAVIVGLNVPMRTPMPNVTLIEGKGQ